MCRDVSTLFNAARMPRFAATERAGTVPMPAMRLSMQPAESKWIVTGDNEQIRGLESRPTPQIVRFGIVAIGFPRLVET